jgi:S-DNA-T family DNA segregation ATPase FtsK/SpoIIIE
MSHRAYRFDAVAFLLLLGTVFAATSLATFDPADPPATMVWPTQHPPRNLMGPAGAWLAWYLLHSFGAAAWVLVLAASCSVVLLFARHPVACPGQRVVGWLLVMVVTAALADRVSVSPALAKVALPGGLLGAAVNGTLDRYFSATGSYLLLSAGLIAGLSLLSERLLLQPLMLLVGLTHWLRGGARTFLHALAGRRASGTIRNGPEGTLLQGPLKALPAPERTAGSASLPAADLTQGSDPAVCWEVPRTPPSPPARPLPTATGLCLPGQGTYFELPPLTLLDDPPSFPYEQYRDEILAQGQKLKQTLAEFGYNVEVVEIHTGPVITQYEISLESGLRVGKIHSLCDDIAIALKAPSVRVVAPLPGKDTVGIEVPNPRRQYVRLKEVIQGAYEKAQRMQIPLFIGKDVKGNPLVYDLAEMPHLLIAGRTGTGKSVCLNALILSVLMTKSPHEVKLLLIDPKLVELSQYRRIPHLMHPVVTDMKKAEAILAWAVEKMEERYDLLARVGVRHLKAYNGLDPEEIYRRLHLETEEDTAPIPVRMPHIVIFADEMADLMMTAPKEVEGHIIRLAQKSRAVGIHLVFATQKPTVDVITGLIKSNLPARICFQVSSRSDSRVVLDEMGGEKLLGNGDMLFLVPGTSQTIRAQGTYVSDQEIHRVVQFLERYEAQYSKELVQLARASGSGSWGRTTLARDRDELYEQAVEIVVREGRGSVSLLQRALGIGYGRAARLIDYMAEDGIVGEYNGSQAREVLITLEEWEAMKGRPSLEETP